jgi:hypothetical protein
VEGDLRIGHRLAPDRSFFVFFRLELMTSREKKQQLKLNLMIYWLYEVIFWLHIGYID